MVQNLRNTVEAQINRMEAQIEKIQEMFNKHLEDLRNRKSVVNKTCEIKDTWEGTHRRMSEGEEWISELEVRMVNKTEAEHDK